MKRKNIKIMIFTEGTIIMHKNAIGHNHKQIIKQVETKEKSVHDYKSYIPIGNAAEKLKNWGDDGAEIFYLTSRKKLKISNKSKMCSTNMVFLEAYYYFAKKLRNTRILLRG